MGSPAVIFYLGGNYYLFEMIFFFNILLCKRIFNKFLRDLANSSRLTFGVDWLALTAHGRRRQPVDELGQVLCSPVALVLGHRPVVREEQQRGQLFHATSHRHGEVVGTVHSGREATAISRRSDLGENDFKRCAGHAPFYSNDKTTIKNCFFFYIYI